MQRGLMERYNPLEEEEAVDMEAVEAVEEAEAAKDALAAGKQAADHAGAIQHKVDHVGVIQRVFKRRKLVFSKFGPSIFSRKGGKLADYGSIYFSSNGREAPFITIADTTSTNLLSTFIEKHWGLARPQVLISVTGGAQDFVLSPKLKHMFNRGLVSAAHSANAWIFTGGTDTGVMKLVAEAIHSHGVKLPLIGVTSHGCVNGRDALECARGSVAKYVNAEPASPRGAPLSPNHSHFILVDNGTSAPAAWGGEISLRASLEDAYTAKGVPLVLICAQGGPGTLQTVLEMCRRGQAVLIVNDTGGAADAIVSYCRDQVIPDPKFQPKEAQLAEIRRLHEESGGKIITFFSVDDEVEMSTMLLMAIVKNIRATKGKGHAATAAAAATSAASTASAASASDTSNTNRAEQQLSSEQLARSMLLAVNWDRLDVAKDLVSMMSVISAEQQFTYGHNVALQHVLEKQRLALLQVTPRAGADRRGLPRIAADCH